MQEYLHRYYRLWKSSEETWRESLRRTGTAPATCHVPEQWEMRLLEELRTDFQRERSHSRPNQDQSDHWHGKTRKCRRSEVSTGDGSVGVPLHSRLRYDNCFSTAVNKERLAIAVDQQQRTFDKLKESLTKNHVMSYLNPKLKTEVIVDASPVGL